MHPLAIVSLVLYPLSGGFALLSLILSMGRNFYGGIPSLLGATVGFLVFVGAYVYFWMQPDLVSGGWSQFLTAYGAGLVAAIVVTILAALRG